jgi:hypothetical protein
MRKTRAISITLEKFLSGWGLLEGIGAVLAGTAEMRMGLLMPALDLARSNCRFC